MARNGTPMQRLRDRQRVSVAPERIQYLQERGLEIAVEQVEVVAAVAATDASTAVTTANTASATATTALDAAGDAVVLAEDASDDAAQAQLDVDGLADGTTPFTAVNVGGVNVKPFLDKTDGAKLTDTSALDDEVVTTPAIAASAVTDHDFDFTAGVVSCDSETPVIVATKAVTLLAGEAAALTANCTTALTTSGTGARGFISIFRDGVEIASSKRTAIGLPASVAVEASATTQYTDEPGAGTFTYTLRAYVDNDSAVSLFDVSYRYLGVTRVKR